MPRVLATFALLGLFTALVLAAPGELPAPRPVQVLPSRFQGTAGCAAAGCHHANGPSGTKGSEYTTWADRDPHSRAFSVLHEQRSRDMLQRYRQLGSRVAAPHKDALCLKCHTIDPPAAQRFEPVEGNLRVEHADGVGCEACHGPAERWRTTHYQDDWKTLDRAGKSHQSLYPTKDYAFRVGLCARCHVGAPGMEVDHDLIAAGHPRLNFEAAAYHELYPKHWRETTYGGDFPVRAWAIGQVATARAALELLAHRASEAAVGRRAAWPELSESACFACHHDLAAPSWRQARKPAGAPGRLPWGTWYTPLVRTLALLPGPFKAPEAVEARFAKLTRLMETNAPDAAAVASEARSLVALLDTWALQLQGDADRAAAAHSTLSTAEVRTLVRQIAGRGLTPDGQSLTINDWESATQTYLALAAGYRGLIALDPSERTPECLEAFKRLRQPLQFGRGRERYDSPRSFTPDAFRELLRTTLSRIEPTP